jgi:magnesium transporter
VQIVRGGDGTEIDAALASGEYLWVDLIDPTPEAMAVVQAKLDLHPLAVEDSEEFSQLPKIDHYGHHLLLVFFGARLVDEEGDDVHLVETHLFVADHWLVTVRREPCLSLDHLVEHPEGPGDDRWTVYRVIDTLTDSFFPVMHALELRIERLEDQVLEGEEEGIRREIVRIRHPVLKLDRVLATQRDTFYRASSDLAKLPGLGTDSTAYFADVQDHLRRLALRADSERERLTGAIHLADSVTNTRLARASERLSLIATIFLPLTAVASFFGMNFAWMVDGIDTAGWFFGLGVGLPLVTLAILIAYIRRRGYLD